VITDLQSDESSPADSQPSASAVIAEPRSGDPKNASGSERSVRVNDGYKIVGDLNQRDGAGRRSTKDETDATSEEAIRSLAQEAASGDSMCHHPGRPCGTQARGDSGQKSYGKSMQDGRAASRLWPAIPDRVREAMDFVARGDGADGWLGAIIPLTSLGIAGGVFALRTRFLR
jgi:hypothetical protein